jgi:hypothetical protein
MKVISHWPVLAIIAACSNDSSGSSTLPADARTLDSYVKAGVNILIPRLGGVEGSLPFLLNPGSPGAEGLSFTPGSAPNSWLFTIPIDGNGDGINETTLSGTATFNGDPASAGIGFGGHLDLNLTTAGGLGDFTGTLDFTLTAGGREISGTGTFAEVVTGNSTTITVDPAHPMVMKPATGAGDAMPNACGYSLNGSAAVEVDGSRGTLASVWNFLANRRNVTVTSASFTDTSGKTTTLPDASVTIPCGSGTVGDWVGTFQQHYACLPPEFGTATLTLASAGGTTISVSDEDPPGSGDVNTYQATTVPGNPHVLKGYFIGGPPGDTYREDFTWTLADNGGSFSQISHYTYLEGAAAGTGGLCGGRATRTP